MSIPKLPFQSERRDQARRSADRVDDYLHKTFSTPHCHSCLEHMADGVLLLDSETRVIYATPQVNQLMKRHNSPFALSPKFTLSRAMLPSLPLSSTGTFRKPDRSAC